MRKTIMLSCLAVVCVPTVYAQTLQIPGHLCVKPGKPYKFNSLTEWGEFNYARQKYQKCIKDYIEEQNAAIERRQEAAAKAVAEWNRFVKNELN